MIMDIMSTPEEIMKDALRRQLKGLLDECTVTQCKQFENVFKCTADDLPDAQVIHAIEMCQRTVRRNRADRGSLILQSSVTAQTMAPAQSS